MTDTGLLINRKGAALIVAMVLVFFLTLFGLAFYQLGETDIPLISHEEDLAQTLYAAESGLERVGWLVKDGDDVTNTTTVNFNPFGTGYDEAAAVSLANPSGGDFYPSGQGTPYFRLVNLQGLGSKVRARVLGAVDLDGDGETGWPSDPDADGFRMDPDDVNRKIEANIGLPGSLGHDVSGGAINGFVDAGGTAIAFEAATFPFYGGSIPVLEDDAGNPGLVLSSPIEIGDSVALPTGLFEGNGNLRVHYFADLDKDQYGGPQSFDGATYSGSEIALVVGDATVSGNWEGKDVTIVSTNRITVTDDVNCGYDGRLILIAPTITINGTQSTKVNGIAVASTHIVLDGDGTQPVTSTDNAAVFVGTLLAGGNIRLQTPGWVVVFEENIINGRMLVLATLTYDDMEDEDTALMYLPVDLGVRDRIAYSASEIASEAGDSQDVEGIFQNPEDWTPNAMKMELAWSLDAVRVDLSGPNALFNDTDIDSIRDAEGYHDWTSWDRITFWMKLGNWQHAHTTKTATILVTLTDANDLQATKLIDYGLSVQDPDTYEPYEVAEWTRVNIRFSEFQTPVGFDRSKIKDIAYSYRDLDMDLGVYGRIEFDEADGRFEYFDPSVDLWYEINADWANYRLFYMRGFTPYYISWYNERDVFVQGGGGFPYGMRTYNVAARMAIDRLELAGSTTQDYGLPSCFQYDLFGWSEID
jgi:hypothetical protein